MLRAALATLERAAPRAASSVVVLLFGVVGSPAGLGYYSIAMLIVTLLQTVTIGALGHIIARELGSARGRALLRRVVWSLSIGGSLASAAVLGIIWTLASAAEKPLVGALLPIVLVPTAMALGVIPVGELQVAQRWAALARSQLIAVAVSLAFSLPVLLITQSAIALGLQLLLAEGIFSVLVRVASRKLPAPVSLPRGESGAFQFAAASASSALSWGQIQMDRLLIGAAAGPSVLGLYSLGWSLSRSISDAGAYGTLNLLRSRLLATQLQADAARREINSHLLRSTLICLGGISATLVLAEIVLPVFLDVSWRPAFEAAMVLSLTALPFALELTASTLLTAARRLHKAIPLRVADVLLALPVVGLVSISLEAALWYTLARQWAVAGAHVALLRRNERPWRGFLLVIAASLVATGCVWLLTTY